MKIKSFQLTCVRESDVEYRATTSPEAMVKLLRTLWPPDIDVRESFMIVCLDTRNKPIGYSVLFTGGVDSVNVDPKIVFAFALQVPGCANIILAHNHPSGVLEPSRQDIELTKAIRTVSNALVMPLLDHIILTESGYYSFANEDKL